MAKPINRPSSRLRREGTRIVNPAAAALGVGINPSRWTVDGIIFALTNRYLQLIKLAEEEKVKGNTRKQRLHSAGAYELAQIVASYYQDKGSTEDFIRWDARVKRASAVAYRRDSNEAVSTLEVGASEDPGA